jgi:uncharacterized integral membrane protein (TIGR00698 family)
MNNMSGLFKSSLKYITGIIPGVFLAFIIAAPSWYMGKKFPLIGGPVIAILLGIFLTAFFRFSPGIQFTSKKILQYSIILLGFEMNLQNILRVGGQSLLVMIFTLSTAFITALFAGRILKLPNNTTILIGVGTSICGGSAIAAVAPVIYAEDEDVIRAISTIFLFNIAAVFIFPSLGQLLNMTDVEFGIWAGTAVNDTSSVMAAGTAWSNMTGNNTALQFATIVKLTRTLMIVPITLVLAIYTARRLKKSSTNIFQFTRVFPWFVIFFVIASVINTIFSIPQEVSSALVSTGKFMIVLAMASIGLNTNLKNLFASGVKPIVLGLSCWFMVAAISLLVQFFIMK